MWEFCLSTYKLEVARSVFQAMKEELGDYQTVLTCYEKYGIFNIIFACPSEEKIKFSPLL